MARTSALLRPLFALSMMVGASVVVSASGAPPVAPGVLPSLSMSATAPSAIANVSSRRGVVVLAVGPDTADVAWPVALAVYADATLRPALADRDARALAGATVAKDAPASTRELAELRAKITGDDAASRVMLGEVARRTGALSIVMVFAGAPAPAPAPAPAEARIYDAGDDRIESTLYRAETSSAGWSPMVTVLHGRYARGVSSIAPVSTSAAPTKPVERKGFFESPWFWGAVGAAVVGGIVVYAATRDPGAPGPVRIDWGSGK